VCAYMSLFAYMCVLVFDYVCVCVCVCVCVYACVWVASSRTRAKVLVVSLCVYVCVLQYVTVCCRVSRVSQCGAVCSACMYVWCSVLQCIAVCCNVLQCVAVMRTHEVSTHTIPKCIMSHPIYWGADTQYFQIPANKPYISAKKSCPEMHNFIKIHHVKSYMSGVGVNAKEPDGVHKRDSYSLQKCVLIEVTHVLHSNQNVPCQILIFLKRLI